MSGYSLRKSNDPNILKIYCHQCGEILEADKRLAKNLYPPEGMAWPLEQGPPTQQSLLWNRLIESHTEKCKRRGL